MKLKIVNVVGARPNFMKIAPILRATAPYHESIEPYLVHTGQHYDRSMSELLFDQLRLPKPDYYLGVRSGMHGEQTGKIMMEFERCIMKLSPDLVMVVGDVNSTIACSLVAAKLGIRVAHVEAGLRSFDRTMPEEVNRVLTDQISDYLFTTEASAKENLRKEGISEDKIHFVGNVMIDTLLHFKELASRRHTLEELNLSRREYALVTLHRPSNVDDEHTLKNICAVLKDVADRIPVLFPAHPRTHQTLISFGLLDNLKLQRNMRLVEPMGYLDFLNCMENAAVVVTDSGGIQEETTVLRVPCVTARKNTERPVTVTHGTNVVAGVAPESLRTAIYSALEDGREHRELPELWDGLAGKRIMEIIAKREGIGLPGPREAVG